MKATIIFPLLLLFSFLASAQKYDAQKVYNLFETQDDVIILSLKKELLDAVDLDLDIEEQLKHIEGDITYMKTLIASSKESAMAIAQDLKNEMDQLRYKVTHVNKENDSVETEGDLYMYTKSKGNKISEIHFLSINQQDSGLFFFTILGDLTLTE